MFFRLQSTDPKSSEARTAMNPTERGRGGSRKKEKDSERIKCQTKSVEMSQCYITSRRLGRKKQRRHPKIATEDNVTSKETQQKKFLFNAGKKMSGRSHNRNSGCEKRLTVTTE